MAHEDEPMTRRSRTIITTFLVCGASLLLLTIPFWIWPLDLAVQGRFFDPVKKWHLGEAPLWQALYRFGTMPAILVVLGALVVFVLSFRLQQFVVWRKASAYLVLCMAVGPGLIINAGFKDNWGRPRPRHVEPFGGEYAHERVWIADSSSPGKSFPCGHCSMGFYFLGLALLARSWRRALLISGFALVFGAVIGVARIAMGGHFLSDVLWSGGFCLLASLGLYFVMGLDRSVRYVPKREKPLKVPPVVAISATSIGIVALLSVALGTPYHENQVFGPKQTEIEKIEFSLVLEGNEHLITPSENGRIEIRSMGDGFGLPGSAIKVVTKEEKSDDELYYQLKQRKSGWFTELKQTNEIRIPAELAGSFKVVVRSGILSADLSNMGAEQRWRFLVEDPEMLQIVAGGEGAGAEYRVLPLEE